MLLCQTFPQLGHRQQVSTGLFRQSGLYPCPARLRKTAIANASEIHVRCFSRVIAVS
jgi:hypothetical protein